MKKNDGKNTPGRMDEKKFRQISRREVLKLTPVLALGAFAIPKWQEGLLKKGLGFSDWASARLFRPGHLATTFDNSALTPPPKFPINGYDVDDPGVDLENWTLAREWRGAEAGAIQIVAISGAAAGAAEYAPRMRGRLGRNWKIRRGAAVGFSEDGGCGSDGEVHHGELRGRLLRVAGYADGAASADLALL